MLRKSVMLAATLGLSVHSLPTQATLTSYTGSDGAGLVYSSLGDVTWTQDANLLGSMETSLGYNTVVNAIIAASPNITDTPNGYDTPSNSGQYKVTSADFAVGGYVNWFGAQAFVGYLNSIQYGGSQEWRLPTSNAVYGYDGTAGNELGQLFYKELNGTSKYNTPNMPDSSFFINEKAYAYWSGTEYAGTRYATNPLLAWFFDTYRGVQDTNTKGGGSAGYLNKMYAWAVSPGQVSAVTPVPLPSAVWLMGGCLLGLARMRRRR